MEAIRMNPANIEIDMVRKYSGYAYSWAASSPRS